MFDNLILILTICIAIIGFIFLALLWSNAEMKSIFDKFSMLRIDGSIQGEKVFKPTKFYKVSKRIIDVTFAFFAIFVLSPILLSISILIKIESKGPIFFLQKRLGINGSHYFSYKFRTLYYPEEEESSKFPMRFDKRITRIGRFLRVTSLDELPTFINVLFGDMSIVGRSRILDYEISSKTLSQEEKEALFCIKPGITSLWAISKNRFDYKFDNIYDYDMYYLRNMSFSFDMKIIFASIILTLGFTSLE